MSIDRGHGIATSSVLADSYDLDALIADTEAAKVAALAAQAAAEIAETNSETAETNSAASATASAASAASVAGAEAATAASAAAALVSENNAQSSENDAETAQVAAELAETHAETAETNAETAETAAVAAQTAALASQTSATASQTSATASATSATASATSATASAASAASSAAGASSSATDAQSSEDDAATSETNASASATSASGSATTATTQATNAATSATTATTQATNASTSATTATTQAGIATTKAGEAATSATNAATSATNAAASEAATADKLPLAGGTMTGDVSLGDNVKAKFGAGDDLQIYHSGTTSWIRDSGTGNLVIDTNGSYIALQGSGPTEVMARFFKDSAVQLYHDNALKLATTSTGIDVTGAITCDGLVVESTGPSLILKDLDSVGAAASGSIKFNDSDNTTSATLGFLSSSNSDFDIFQSENANIDIWTNGANRMRITSAGNVGIGTTVPSSILEIRESGLSIPAVIRLIGTNNASSTSSVSSISSEESPSGGSAAADMVFSNRSVGDAFDSPTEKLRITSAGQVGIGTSSPGNSLHVIADSGVRFDRGGKGIHFNPNYSAAGVHAGITVDSGLGLHFSTDGNNTQTNPQMVIRNNGNVGIGTTTPNAKLDVSAETPTIRLTDTTQLSSWPSGTVLSKIETYNEDASGNGPMVTSFIKTVSEAGSTLPSGALVFGTAAFNVAGGAVERVRFPSTGGITFNGDTAAANALDDYEVGNWTPAIRGVAGNTYASFTTYDCKYIKIGKSVTITGYLGSIVWSGITNGGSVIMEGLPYATPADNYSSVSFGYNNTNLTGGYVENNGVVYFVIGSIERNQINNDITGDKFMFSVTYILA